MLKPKQTSALSVAMPDLTALLDVLFIMLVFLLLSVAVRLDMLEVTLPQVGEDAAQVAVKREPVVLSVLIQDGQLQYGLAQQQFSELAPLLNQLKSSKPKALVLAIDAKLPSEHTIALLAKLSQLNIELANILIKHQ